MERVSVVRLRKELAHWLSRAEKGRVMVTKHNLPALALVPLPQARLLEAMESAGTLEAAITELKEAGH